MNTTDKKAYYKQKYRKGNKPQTTQEPKTFEFSVLPLWESITFFLVFALLFTLPIFYMDNLQKWWGGVIRLYLPIVFLCTLGYLRLRSRKISVEVIGNQKFTCRLKNELLIVPCSEIKIFYMWLFKRKIGTALRIGNKAFYIHSEGYGKEKMKEYDLNIQVLQSAIGNNSNHKRIDFILSLITRISYVIMFIGLLSIILFLVFLIAVFTDNLHWFNFLKSLL